LQEAKQKRVYQEHEQQLLQLQQLPALDTLLICPIQRLPRYRLLLESLLSLTPDDHVDRSALERALEAVKSGVEAVNAGKARNFRLFFVYCCRSLMLLFSSS
jgi:hypothetical protein